MSGHRLRASVVGLLVAATIALATTETLLRLFGHASIPIRQLLYLAGEAPRFDGVKTLDDLMANAPLPLPPLRVWGGFRLNAHGLYTGEYSRAKPPGTFRVVTVGDSFTFDSGMVPPTSIWHAQLGVALARQLGRPVEVINLGLPAVGPRFAAKMYDVEGRYLSPDLVILGLFLGNDLTDESGVRSTGLMRYSYTWRAARHAWSLWRSWRQIESSQAQWREANDGEPVRGGVPVAGFTYDPELAFLSPEEFTRVERDTAATFARRNRDRVVPSVHDVVAVADGLRAQVTATPARFLVALFPDQLQIDVSLREGVLHNSGMALADFDADGVTALLRDGLTARGMSVVDVTPALAAAPSAPRLYRRQDVHWTIAGNTVAAQAVLAALSDLR